MDSTLAFGVFIFWLIGAGIGLAILYWVIRLAVRAAIRDSRKVDEIQPS